MEDVFQAVAKVISFKNSITINITNTEPCLSIYKRNN